MSELCFSVPRLASHLGVGRGRISTAIVSGELPAFRIGTAYRVRLSDVPAHLLERWIGGADDKDVDLPTGQMVYFLGVPGFVKIGFTTDLALRVRNLQPGSPYRLELLAFRRGAAMSDERAYHRTFRRHRVEGEWFRLAPEVKAEILRLRGEA